MAFFTSNLNLAEEFADPKVTQQTGIGQAISPLTPSSAQPGMLSELTRPAPSGYSSGSGWSDLGDLSSLGTSALSSATGVESLTGFGTSGFGTPTIPANIIETLTGTSDTEGTTTYSSDSDGGFSDSASTAPRTLEEYLQAKENTPEWQTYMARALVPGFSALSSLTDLSYGINPFYDTKIGGLFGAEPTTDWYEGETDWLGRPFSEKELGQQELRDLYTNFNFYKGSGMLPEGIDWEQFKQSKGDVWGEGGALGDIKSDISSLGTVFETQKGWTEQQFSNYQGALDTQINSLKNTLAANQNLNKEQRDILENTLYEMTDRQIQSLNAQLTGIQDTSSQQYGDLLSQLETVEGDLTQQINDSYQGQYDTTQQWIDDLTGKVDALTSQEYVVEDPKTQNIFTDVTDTTAGGYTWDSGLGTVEEMQEETGLGTSEWDTSHSDFSWGDSSDAGDGTTDASDDPGGDDDNAGGWSFSDDDSGGGDSGGGDSGGGGGSYIATAATQALGEEGLTIFENWRDYMFDALPTFTTSYGRYRVTAPKIVAEIDKKDNSKEIYSWIWDMHLKPIFDMITEDRDSTKALKDYKIMVRELQNKFLSKEKV